MPNDNKKEQQKEPEINMAEFTIAVLHGAQEAVQLAAWDPRLKTTQGNSDASSGNNNDG